MTYTHRHTHARNRLILPSQTNDYPKRMLFNRTWNMNVETPFSTISSEHIDIGSDFQQPNIHMARTHTHTHTHCIAAQLAGSDFVSAMRTTTDIHSDPWMHPHSSASWNTKWLFGHCTVCSPSSASMKRMFMEMIWFDGRENPFRNMVDVVTMKVCGKCLMENRKCWENEIHHIQIDSNWIGNQLLLL